MAWVVALTQRSVSTITTVRKHSQLTKGTVMQMFGGMGGGMGGGRGGGGGFHFSSGGGGSPFGGMGGMPSGGRRGGPPGGFPF